MKLKYIAIQGDAKNKEEAIGLCGEALFNSGFVGKTFSENCILREREFPTGLPTNIPVAIPHCKDESVIQDSVCFLKLNRPIQFYRMDDEEEIIETDIVFNLAIKESEKHVDVLSNLIKFVTNSENLELCKSLDILEIPKFLENKIG